MKNKVAIIIPVFNTEQYLNECLNSVCNQTMQELEILCVYTESKDKSLEILQKFEKKDNRVRIIRRDDGGLGGARNEGLKHVNSNYVFFLDSDDFIAKNAIEELYNKATEENSDMVIFPFFSYNETTKKVEKNSWGNTLNFNKQLFNRTFNYFDIEPSKIITDNSPVTAWCKLYKTEFLKSNNILFPENLRYEDNPFYYECLLKAKRISLLDQKLLYYRINRNNSLQASKFNNKNILDIVTILKQIEVTFTTVNANEAILNNFYKYAMHEFEWRYFKMTLHRDEMLELIKSNFTEKFYNELLHKINYNKPEHIVIKEHEEISSPKLSIVLPTYNVEKYIEDCILSIINQTLEEIEIIFVNDLGNDESINIIKKYMQYDKRIKIVNNKQNMGAGPSRNEGIKAASGNYICFMDPDDMYASPNILEKMYNIAINENVDAVCANIKVVDDSLRYYSFDKIYTWYSGYNVENNGIYSYSDYNIWPSWGSTRFMFKTLIIKDNEIEYPPYRNYEDPLFFAKLMCVIDKYYGINEAMYLYRQVDKQRNLSYVGINDTLKSLSQILELYKENSLYNHYASEYNNLLNFIKNDFSSYIFNKKDNYKVVIENINKTLEKLDKEILTNYSNNKIYLTYNDITKVEKIKPNKSSIMKRGIKKVLAPIYRPIKYRLNTTLDEKKWEVEKEVLVLKQQNVELKTELEELIKKVSEAKSTNDILLDNINQEIKKLDNKNLYPIIESYYNNLYFEKKIILVGTSEHSNIGDAAITCGTMEFIRKYFKGYKIFEISTFELQEKIVYMKKMLNDDDLIFLQGGGNLGDKWLNEERLRRTIIESFPNNKIVILPQTIYFSKNDGGKEFEISQKIYNSHKKILLFTRGMMSLEFAKREFKNVESYCNFDMALNLNYKFNFERNGILCCLRDLNDESGISQNDYDNILEIISKYDKKYTFINNLYSSEINKIERNMVVGEQLIKFAKSKVIVTDRLHGLIFALITNTPCIVISSYNQKLKEFTDMLKDNKSIIFIDKDISKLEKNLEALYNLEDNTIKNDFSKELNKVADIIKGFNEK